MKSLFILFLFPVFSALAGLTWSNTEVKIAIQLTDETATGGYQFKNETTKDITITDTKSSCGCTTAKLDKKTYAPGESGKIVAHFDIGGRVGPQHKTITVTTDDAPNKPTVLELSVDIPDPIEPMKPLLIWKIGDNPSEQIFTIKAKDGFKIHIKDIRCSNAFFTAKIDSAKDGSVYNIAVTPVKTDAKVFGLLIVTTDFPANNPRVVYSQLQVQ